MEKRLKDVLADHVKDWTTLTLAGLGISFAPYEWIGGMFLAVAGATFAMRSDPEQDRRELWLVILGAFLASHLAAMASHKFFPDFPVQVSMFLAGFFSRRITRFALRMAGLIESRGDKIADRVIDRFMDDQK
jgi:hypothetical protein